MRTVLGGVLAAGLWMAVNPASAATIISLPPEWQARYPTNSSISGFAYSLYFGSVYGSGQSQTEPLQWSGSAGSAYGFAITEGGTLPSVSASAMGSASASPLPEGGSDEIRAYGTALYSFYFRVYDPSPTPVDVPISITFALGTTGSGSVSDEALASVYWRTQAFYYLGSPSQPTFWSWSNSFGDGNSNISPGSHTLNQMYTTNAAFYMGMSVLTEVQCGAGADYENGSSCSASASAFVDPSINIDPAWLSAHPDAVLQMGSVAGGVPEPCTLLVIGSGLLGLGALWRRSGSRSRGTPRATSRDFERSQNV